MFIYYTFNVNYYENMKHKKKENELILSYNEYLLLRRCYEIMIISYYKMDSSNLCEILSHLYVVKRLLN